MICVMLAGVLIMFCAAAAGVAVITAPAARRVHIQCVQCGYSLTGNLTGVCPECGRRRPDPGHPEPFVEPLTRWVFRASGILVGMAIVMQVVRLCLVIGKGARPHVHFEWGVGLPALLTAASYALALGGTRFARWRASSVADWPACLLAASTLSGGWALLSFVALVYE